MSLSPREQAAADHLRVRLHRPDPVAVTVSGERVVAEIRKRRGELHVACEQLPGRAHRGIPDVVADSREVPEADELPRAELRPRTTDLIVIRMFFRKPHLWPDLQRPTALAMVAVHVIAIRPTVVEQVELDELDALILEIEQRAVDAPAVRPEMADVEQRTTFRTRITRSPVVRPIDTWG